MHPTQQHGLRIPPVSFEIPFLIRIFRVSSFLPDVTQQIHSLRASGVISSHTIKAFGEEMSAFRKSSGNLCTVPVATPFVIMRYILSNLAVSALSGFQFSDLCN